MKTHYKHQSMTFLWFSILSVNRQYKRREIQLNMLMFSFATDQMLFCYSAFPPLYDLNVLTCIGFQIFNIKEPCILIIQGKIHTCTYFNIGAIFSDKWMKKGIRYINNSHAYAEMFLVKGARKCVACHCIPSIIIILQVTCTIVLCCHKNQYMAINNLEDADSRSLYT